MMNSLNNDQFTTLLLCLEVHGTLLALPVNLGNLFMLSGTCIGLVSSCFLPRTKCGWGNVLDEGYFLAKHKHRKVMSVDLHSSLL